jgi:hypothetical protein
VDQGFPNFGSEFRLDSRRRLRDLQESPRLGPRSARGPRRPEQTVLHDMQEK